MEISNKTLAMFLVAAIVISLAGTIISLNKLGTITGNPATGYASLNTTATAQLTVNTTSDIRFLISTVNWGSGSVNVTIGWCNMTTLGANSAGCQSFSTVSQGLTLVNDGNNNVSVTLYSNLSAASFLGGTNPKFQYNVSNNQSNSCPGGAVPAAFTDVNTTIPGTQICALLDFNPTKDSLLIGVQVNFSYDAPQGAKSALFYAIGTSL